MHIPFPNVHVATLQCPHGTMPHDVSTDARGTRHDGVIVDGHGAGPATLALLMLILRMILELDGARTSVVDGMVRGRASMTRTPEDGGVWLATCTVGGKGVRIWLHVRLLAGGWRLGVRPLVLLRAVGRWSGALLLEWRRLPHRLGEGLLSRPGSGRADA